MTPLDKAFGFLNRGPLDIDRIEADAEYNADAGEVVSDLIEELRFLRSVRDNQAAMIRKMQYEADCLRNDLACAQTHAVGFRQKLEELESGSAKALRLQVSDLQRQLARAEAKLEAASFERMKRRQLEI